MKKKPIVLIIALIAYCYLFYKQSAGINLLIFNAILVACLLIVDQTLVKSKVWLATAAGAIITSAGALLYGNFLACFGNVFSLLLLAHLSIDKNASLVFSFLQSAWSYMTVYFLFIIELIEPKPEAALTDKEKESKYTFNNILKFVIPLAVLLTFFLIYRESNPVFSKFIDNLNIEISWEFVGFMSLGLLLLYGFFYSRKFRDLTQIDENSGNSLSGGIKEKEFNLFSSIDKELSAAVMTFVLLNVLLLLVNVLDLNFILSGKHHGIEDYSKYVHQGINSSIFSVLIAILVTMYFFRGNLNFVAKNKAVKMLALIWIILNAVLLFTCLHKNYSYISACGLTHKRIGVYIYLFLTFIGLVTTWIKITQWKSNLFLVRMNMWPMYLTLVLSTLINWNKLILDYNSHHTASVEREYYFYNLPETSLPYLLENWKSLPAEKDYFRSISDEGFESILNYKKQLFLWKYKNAGWQSWNFESERIYQLLQQPAKRVK